MTVRRFVGVYDADGTVVGELSYFLKARMGRAHCALCDVTHGRVRRKRAWVDACGDLTVPFDTYHRDDQPEGTRALGSPPLVAAELDDGTYALLLDGAAIEACNGDPARLISALLAAAR
jgi:hypothetical protein